MVLLAQIVSSGCYPWIQRYLWYCLKLWVVMWSRVSFRRVLVMVPWGRLSWILPCGLKIGNAIFFVQSIEIALVGIKVVVGGRKVGVWDNLV